MTYTATRWPIFLPEMNTVDLNSTLIVPNLAVLVSYNSSSDERTLLASSQAKSFRFYIGRIRLCSDTNQCQLEADSARWENVVFHTDDASRYNSNLCIYFTGCDFTYGGRIVHNKIWAEPYNSKVEFPTFYENINTRLFMEYD